MGLDWMLHKHVPKPGREKVFTDIKNKLKQLDADEGLDEQQRKAARRELENTLFVISITPYDVVGAPRVGVEPEATEWFRRNVYEPAQRAIEQERKLPLADGVPVPMQPFMRNEGFIAYWSRPFEAVLSDEHGNYVIELAREKRGLAAITGMLTSPLDFRGKVVGSAEWLPEDLRNEAYDEHDAEQSLDYAARLEVALHEADDEHLPEVVDVRLGITWMRYWAENGFGWSPWW